MKKLYGMTYDIDVKFKDQLTDVSPINWDNVADDMKQIRHKVIDALIRSGFKPPSDLVLLASQGFEGLNQKFVVERQRSYDRYREQKLYDTMRRQFTAEEDLDDAFSELI